MRPAYTGAYIISRADQSRLAQALRSRWASDEANLAAARYCDSIFRRTREWASRRPPLRHQFRADRLHRPDATGVDALVCSRLSGRRFYLLRRLPSIGPITVPFEGAIDRLDTGCAMTAFLFFIASALLYGWSVGTL
jgi:hypothetical protein